MNFILIKVKVKRSSAATLQLTAKLPLKGEACKPLLELKLYCLKEVDLPNCYVSAVNVNGLDNYNDDDQVYHTDEVEVIVCFRLKNPTTACSSGQSTSTERRTNTSTNKSTTANTALPPASMNGTSSHSSSSTKKNTTISVLNASTSSSSKFDSYDFVPVVEFREWQQNNMYRIQQFFKDHMPQKGLKYCHEDLHSYFNKLSRMSVLVYYGWQLERNGNPDELYNAEDRILKLLADFLHHARPYYDVYTKDVNEFLTVMHEWLRFPIFLRWIEMKSNSRLQNIMKKMRWYHGGDNAKKRFVSTFTTDDEEELEQLAEFLRQSHTEEATERELQSTVYLRRAWVHRLNNDAAMEKGVATTFFEKLPIYNSRLHLLHYDFESMMQDVKGKVPNLQSTLKTYAPTIIYTATMYSIKMPKLEDHDDDDSFKAMQLLPLLVKQFCPRGTQQSFSHLYTETESPNIGVAMAKRSTFTACPSIVATNFGRKKTFFIAVDDFSLHTPSTEICDAMQLLFEVYYVLGLAYDKHMKDVFQVLEYLMDMKKSYGVGITKLAQILKNFHENPPENFSEVTESTGAAASPSSRTTESSPLFAPLRGLPSVPRSRGLSRPRDFDDSNIQLLNTPILLPTVSNIACTNTASTKLLCSFASKISGKKLCRFTIYSAHDINIVQPAKLLKPDVSRLTKY